MTDQLSLYNGALLKCGERKLASLTENREPRRLLDDAWDGGGAVSYCLELGQWVFATRSAQLDYDPSSEPDFGYQKVFEKPEDYVQTVAVCQDEFFDQPLNRYSDENGYWYCDLETIFVKFVSDDALYGFDYSKWPATFINLVETYLASKIVYKLTQSERRLEKLEKDFEKALRVARGRDAWKQPAKFPPQGSWVTSLRGGRYSRENR